MTYAITQLTLSTIFTTGTGEILKINYPPPSELLVKHWTYYQHDFKSNTQLILIFLIVFRSWMSRRYGGGLSHKIFVKTVCGLHAILFIFTCNQLLLLYVILYLKGFTELTIHPYSFLSRHALGTMILLTYLLN